MEQKYVQVRVRWFEWNVTQQTSSEQRRERASHQPGRVIIEGKVQKAQTQTIKKIDEKIKRKSKYSRTCFTFPLLSGHLFLKTTIVLGESNFWFCFCFIINISHWWYLASLAFGKNCRKIGVNTSGPESIVMTSVMSFCIDMLQSESSICGETSQIMNIY